MTIEDTEPLSRRGRAGREEEGGLTGARTLMSLGELRGAVNECRRCTLWKSTTQGVPGEGLAPSRLMLVGEAPGDSEDLQGHPFVGPAGAILDRALKDAGLGRESVYITNAVKHFKFEPRGKRRLHIKPSASEIEACHWWLDEELRLVAQAPDKALSVRLGRAALSHAVGGWQIRGAPTRLSATSHLWVTIHPSFLLRVPDDAQRRNEYARFVKELKDALAWIERH